MKLTNQQIYNYASQLANFTIDVKLPIRFNFFLNRNIQLILSLGQEIENARTQIAKTYGKLNNMGTSYDIPADCAEVVQSELIDLFALEQEVDLHLFKLEDLNGVELTYEQMKNLMFMMKE